MLCADAGRIVEISRDEGLITETPVRFDQL
jgi:hypothetical protein